MKGDVVKTKMHLGDIGGEVYPFSGEKRNSQAGIWRSLSRGGVMSGGEWALWFGKGENQRSGPFFRFLKNLRLSVNVASGEKRKKNPLKAGG